MPMCVPAGAAAAACVAAAPAGARAAAKLGYRPSRSVAVFAPPVLDPRPRSDGEVPERSNGAVSKTVVLLAGDRGFESLPLRHLKPLFSLWLMSLGVDSKWSRVSVALGQAHRPARSTETAL